jgi:hypothetical protein
MAASLAVVKVEAERARVERSRSSWFQAPTNRPHPGPLAPLPRLVGSSLSALLTRWCGYLGGSESA